MFFSLLRTYLHKYRRLILLVIALQTVQASASLYLPNLNADIIDKGVVTGDTGYIWRIGGVMLLVTGVQMVFSITAVYFGSKAAMGFGRDVRSSLFHRVTDFSAREVDHFGAPSLITRITNDVQQVQLFVVMTFTLVVAAPITIIGGVIAAYRQDAGMTWLLAVSMPILVVALLLITTRMVPTFRLMQLRIDAIAGVLREQITGIRVVRAFVREPQEGERFRKTNANLTATSLRAGRLMALMFPLVNFVVNASSVAVIWVGGSRIANGEMSVGSLVAFLTYFTLILMSVMMAAFVSVMGPRAAVSAERIQEVLHTDSSVVPPATPLRPADAISTVELDHVTFTYPGAEEPVVSDLTFTARPGTTTAIIGSTGSGKTTLINLVARLFDVTTGAVRLGGVDIRELDPEVLWRRIGLVPQKPYLFSGTIRSNLQYGKPDATDEEIWDALRVSQAEDFVSAMPGGLDAVIEQGGTNVSGGQRQRLAIARAVVRAPDVYLFDDSFSALDLSTDSRLRAALAPRIGDAAVIVIAQRVSSIRTADQILVLEEGTAVGLGTHEELLQTCPTYVEIVESQERTAA